MPLIADGKMAHSVRIALINNMPDPALEQTESQFSGLLGTASDVPVSVKLFSLPGIDRGKAAQEYLSAFYSPISHLWESRFDAAILTGTEPHQSDLRNEPYWSVLTEVLDWAAENTSSTILSCLAAHASVLHNDGIDRHLMPEKRVGVFEVRRVSDHPLINRVPPVIRFPHSRWNEVLEAALTSGGYTVLTESTRAGVDSYVKQIGESLFVHFQGHPEYGAQTLLREYRRDVKRFLRRERDRYPVMPHGYFSPSATELLSAFRDKAVRERHEGLLDLFPESSVGATLERTWDIAASAIYGNWLRYVSARRKSTRFAADGRIRQAVLTRRWKARTNAP